MNSLTIPQVPEGTPKEQCFFFLKLQKAGAIGLALNLVKVEREESPEAFEGFWKEDLDISKGYVSKLRKVGNFGAKNGFSYEKLVGYAIEGLYESIVRGEKLGSSPEYILSEAKTWTKQDRRDQKKADCKYQGEPITVCPECWGAYVDGKHP